MNDKGFTLLELLIAVSIFALLITPFFNTIIESIGIGYETQEQLKSNLLAQKYIEEFKSKPIENFMNDPNDIITTGNVYTHEPTLNTELADKYKVEISYNIIEDLKYSESQFNSGNLNVPSTFNEIFTIKESETMGTYCIVNNGIEYIADLNNDDVRFYDLTIAEDNYVYLEFNNNESYQVGTIDPSLDYDYKIYIEDLNERIHMDIENHTNADIFFYVYNQDYYYDDVNDEFYFTFNVLPYSGTINVINKLTDMFQNQDENKYDYFKVVTKVYDTSSGNDKLLKTIESSTMKLNPTSN